MYTISKLILKNLYLNHIHEKLVSLFHRLFLSGRGEGALS
jgi:hypothetical protein